MTVTHRRKGRRTWEDFSGPVPGQTEFPVGELVRLTWEEQYERILRRVQHTFPDMPAHEHRQMVLAILDSEVQR